MKALLAIPVLFVTQFAHACPEISGTYLCPFHDDLYTEVVIEKTDVEMFSQFKITTQNHEWTVVANGLPVTSIEENGAFIDRESTTTTCSEQALDLKYAEVISIVNQKQTSELSIHAELNEQHDLVVKLARVTFDGDQRPNESHEETQICTRR